jgi:CheY-like chemotaxis protein
LLLLGGDFDIQSPPGRGTTIRISVPLQSSAFGEPEQTVDASAAQYAEHRVESANQNSAGNAIRVMLVDDHGVMRKGLSSLLSRYKDIDVVAEAADGVQAVEVAQHINPDIILMDINMPVMDGIKATHILHSRMPRVPIIALSMHDDDLQAAVIKKAGAASFLSKSGHPDAIIAAIRQLYHDMRNDPKSSAESL